jgi:hypothetical protein
VPLSLQDVRKLTDESPLTVRDEGEARYSPGGAYSYRNPAGQTRFGRFRLRPDGRICIDYGDDAGRCDVFVRHGELLFLITEQGKRLPIRVELGVRR